MSDLPFLSSDSEDDENPQNDVVDLSSSDEEEMNDGFELGDNFGQGTFGSEINGAKTGSWDFRSAIEILARNDMRAGAPARTRVDDLIKAQRKIIKGKGGDEDEDKESGDDSSDESSSDEEDEVDNEYEKADLEDDNIKTTLEKGDADDDDDEEEEEDEEEGGGEDDEDSDMIDSEEEAELKKEGE